MKERNDIALVLFIAVIGGAIAWGIASDIAAPSCAAAKAASEEIDKPFLGCVDFWLERYQGLIGGMLALAGAGLTVWIVRKQISSGEQRDTRLSRMAVVPILQKFYDDCMLVAYQIGPDYKPEVTPAEKLPPLNFNIIAERLAHLPPREAHQLILFAQQIYRLNGFHTLRSSRNKPVHPEFIRLKAAQCTHKTASLLAQFTHALGWDPFAMSDSHEKYLAPFIVEVNKLDAAEDEPPL